MPQGREYLDFVMDKFASLDVVSSRKMFGGYVLHMAGKVLGFVFEDRFLFEPGPTVDRVLPDAERMELFPGSKLFVVIDDSMSPRRLCELARECYDDLPLPKPRKKKGDNGRGGGKSNQIEPASVSFPFEKLIGDKETRFVK